MANRGTQENHAEEYETTGSPTKGRNNTVVDMWMRAARNGDTKQINDFLTAGFNISVTDAQNYCALHWASRNGHLPIVSLLLAHTANIECRNGLQSTPLMVAAFHGWSEVVQCLIKKGADVSATGENQWTALQFAAQAGHLDTAIALLKSGAETESRDVAGNTPLIEAAVKGHTKVVQCLLDHGAVVSARGKDGYTALHWTAKNNDASTLSILLDSGANADGLTVRGDTPLTLTATNENNDDVLRLLQRAKGVELPSIFTQERQSPLRTTTFQKGYPGFETEVESHFNDGFGVINNDKPKQQQPQPLEECTSLHPSSPKRFRSMLPSDTGKIQGKSEFPTTTEENHASLDKDPEFHEKQSIIPEIQEPVWPIKSKPDLKIDINKLKKDRNNILGRGSFGYVIKGEYKGKTVAVKEVMLKPNDNANMIETEIYLNSVAKHPNIAHFIGYTCQKECNHWNIPIVFEYIDGNDLENVIYLRKTNKMCIKPWEEFLILCDVAKAVEYLHVLQPPIIHGDIKPANIMLSKNMEVKLCDMGLSKIKHSQTVSLHTTNVPMGTQLYMAPEQLLKGATSSTKTDIYSLGATIFEFIYKTLLREEKSIDDLKKGMREEEKNMQMPRSLQCKQQSNGFEIVRKCVTHLPHDRPTAQYVAQYLKFESKAVQHHS